jgi:hypothetical protein
VRTRQTFSLERIRVEHRAIASARPFRIVLPLPVAANAMYGQAPGRGRFPTPAYADWMERAALRLAAACPPRFRGPVWVAITYEDCGRGEIDDRAKPVLALLAREGVIASDSRACVRGLRLGWGDVTGARVEVRPFAFEDGR